MKNLYKTFFRISVLIVTLASFSCGDNNKVEDPKKVAEEHNDQKFDNEKEKTADFMVYAADLNLHEIQLGELAVGNAYDPQVVKMGKMMVADHTKALEELKALAAQKSVSLPEAASDAAKKDCDKLAKKTKHDFDEEYSEMMVDGHKDAISKFEKEAEEGKDAEVRAWAFAMLPSLRAHMDHALACQERTDGKGRKDTAVVVKNRDVKDHDDVKNRDGKRNTDANKAEAKTETKTEKTKKDW